MSVLDSAENLTVFINPHAPGCDIARERADTLRHRLALAGFDPLTDLPDPKHIQDTVEGKTLVYSGGGDGTVNRVVEAILGHVRDDPHTTTLNQPLHTQLASQLIYVAGADGTANNFAVSALGKRYAGEPAALVDDPMARIGYHRPLVYEVTADGGEIVSTGIATSCIGLGGAAVAAQRLETAKPELQARQEHPKVRLAREALIAFEGIVKTAPFSVVEKRRSWDDQVRINRKAIIGLELVGSHIYAKEGHTSVNVDDTRQQPVILRSHSSAAGQKASILGTMLGVRLGHYRQHPMAFDETSELSLRVTSDAAVPMHTDGETGARYWVEPGQTLRLRLSRIAVPVLMAR